VASLNLTGADEVGQAVDVTVDYQGPTGELLTETNTVWLGWAGLGAHVAYWCLFVPRSAEAMGPWNREWSTVCCWDHCCCTG
jgi:hypothetical protein